MTEEHQAMIRDAVLHSGAAAGPGAAVWLLWERIVHADMQWWVGFWTIAWLIAQLVVLAWRFWRNDLKHKRKPVHIGRDPSNE